MQQEEPWLGHRARAKLAAELLTPFAVEVHLGPSVAVIGESVGQTHFRQQRTGDHRDRAVSGAAEPLREPLVGGVEARALRSDAVTEREEPGEHRREGRGRVRRARDHLGEVDASGRQRVDRGRACSTVAGDAVGSKAINDDE